MKHTGTSGKNRNGQQGLPGGSMAGLPAGFVAGFTLIEIMIAVVILMFGLLVVGSMQISAIRGNYMSGNTSMAISLAGEKMEELINKDYSKADLTAGNHGPEAILKTGTGVEGTGGLYSRSWTVTNETSPTRKSVVVTVSWEKNRHQVSIASIKNQVVW